MRHLGTRLGLLNLALVAVATACVGVISSIEIESYFEKRLVAEMGRESDLFEVLLRRTPAPTYDDIVHDAHLIGVRVTLVSGDGVVLVDSDVPEARLPEVENHGNRPEIDMARERGTGVDSRRSHTIGVDLLYVARRLDRPLRGNSPEFLRLAVPLREVRESIASIRRLIAAGCGAALLIVFAGSLLLSRRIAAPIARLAAAAEEIKKGNLDTRIDVTGEDEAGRLGQALREMLEKLKHDIVELKRLERVRSEFLGNVSHELRTPIFAVQGFIETLLGGAVDDPGVNRDFLKKALDHALRLNTLLNDLIEISRIESGEMKLTLRPFDLKDLLEQLAIQMRPIVEQKGLRLDAPVIHDARVEVLGDRDRIYQVLANLIDNAIKYTDPGGLVKLGIAREDAGVRISVDDTGCGIAEEHVPRIFERFYRVDKTRSREVGGTGLGLAIVKHLVEAHGSSVRVVSTPGRGSSFSFTLRC